MRTVLLSALLLLTASAAGAQTDGSERISSGIDEAAERYSSDVYWLADDARMGRGLGSEGLAKAGLWIEKQFKDIGLKPAGEDGGYRHVFGVPIADPANPHAQKGFVYAFNVVGRIPGNGELDGTVVIGAHYDHLGFGGEGSLEPDSRAIHNGADDNASGVAALLEVARQMQERRGQLKRDVVFVAFAAEERGLVGASNIVRSPPEGLVMEDVIAMLNMDMVGRLRDEKTVGAWRRFGRRVGRAGRPPLRAPRPRVFDRRRRLRVFGPVGVLRRRHSRSALLHRHALRVSQALR